MQNQAPSSEAKNANNSRRSGKNIIVFIIIGICFALIIGLYLLVMAPRYLVLSIPPPEDSYNLVGWGTTTESVITEPGTTHFVWRQEATLAYERFDSIPSWNALAGYFETRFSQIGWKKSDTAPPCNIYLPEAAFLAYGENGYITYLRVNDTDEFPMGDAICLAIWNNKGSPNVFRVVLLTVKPSTLTSFYTIFEQ